MLRESFWLPLKHIGSTLRIFWPFIFLFVAMIVTTKAIYYYKIVPRWSPVNDYIYFATSVFSLYLFVLLCRGLILWHRKIIFGMNENYLPFIFDDRDLRYSFYALGITFLILVGTLVAAYTPLHYVFFAPRYRSFGGVPFIVTISMQFSILWNVIVASFAGIIISFIFKNSILQLPGLAAGDNLSKLRENVLHQHQSGFSWRKNLFVMTSLISVILLLRPINYFRNDMITVVSHEILVGMLALYGGIVFVTLLSLYYREHIRPEYIESAD